MSLSDTSGERVPSVRSSGDLGGDFFDISDRLRSSSSLFLFSLSLISNCKIQRTTLDSVILLIGINLSWL
jgi:hypothetical protein